MIYYAASYILVLILVAEIVLVIFDIEFNIASFLGTEGEYIGGMWVPLGDLRIVGPTVVVVLSVILFTRTRGVYTRWLAGIIFVTCFAIVYLLEPETFQVLLQEAIRLIMRRL